MTYNSTILADAPIDYYQFNETAGTTAADTGSGNHAATHSGGVTLGNAGVAGTAATYDGSSGLTTLPTSLTDFLGGTAFTTEIWVKYDTSVTADYPTFIRRDGNSKTFLVRTRNTSVGRAYIIETYYNGKTVDTGSVTFADGKWHHVVVTVSGTTVRLFVDNVEYTNSVGTATTGTSGAVATYVGRGSGTTEFFKGSLDEVAIYNKALTTTQIAAHYNAGQPVNVTIMATPMTASASMPGGVKVTDINVAATPMTASAEMPNASGVGTKVLATSRAYFPDGVFDATGQQVNLSNYDDGLFLDFELPSDLTGTSTNLTATLRFTGSSTGTATTHHYRVQRIAHEWTAGIDYEANDGTYIGQIDYTQPANSTSSISIDVTSLLANPANFYGFRITDDKGAVVTSAAKTLALSYTSVNASVAVPAQPMTADAVMVDPSVGIAQTINAEPMTASASMVEPIVVGIRNVEVFAEPLQASADMPGGAFSLPVSVTAEPMTATAGMADPTVATTQGVLVAATPMTASAAFVKPSAVNDTPIAESETDDNYFQRVNALKPAFWIRQTDTTETVTNRANGQPMAYYRGGIVKGQHNGPDGRASVYFDGTGYIEQIEPSDSNDDETTLVGSDGIEHTVLEFSIRTTKANQFILAGADNVMTATGNVSAGGGSEVFLSNGHLGYRSYLYNTGNPSASTEFSGFTNVADGKWHHIAIRSGVRSPLRAEYGVEIWLDGKLEVRRYSTPSLVGFPDYIGSRPSGAIDDINFPAFASSQAFVGDMSEVVLYKTNVPSEDDETLNYYAFMGWTPIHVDPMEATASMGDAKGRGNQKRALYLYWTGLDEVFGGLIGEAGQSVAESISFDPNPALENTSTSGNVEPLGEQIADFAGYKVFTKSITRDKVNNTAYRDAVTDEQSLIDLTRDVDLSDYDVIMFKDWPDEGYELDWYEANYPGQKDRLLQQIIDANEAGIGLYVTNPRLAIDLGIVDRVEFVPSLREGKFNSAQGINAYGLYDYRSAEVFPWNIINSDGLSGGDEYAIGIGQTENTSDSFLSNKAYYYFDTHANNRFRVRALIDGLTDVGSFMLQESVFHVDSDEYGNQGAAYKYLERPNGLQIGDEYIFYGTAEIDPAFLDIVDNRYMRYQGTFATPPGHVVAGTVVTTFGATYWQDKQELSNPYGDYATTIVLKPGDSINGRPVGGRIFVNFTETPSAWLPLFVQDITDTNQPHLYGPETAAQREWQYSWTRTTLQITGQQPSTTTISVVLPDGSTANVKLGSGGANDHLAMVRSNQIFPVHAEVRLEMTARGLLWLQNREVVNDGDVVVRATPMNATAAMPEPTVVAQRSVTVHASAMVGTAVMNKVAEDVSGDVEVLALPMYADGEFINPTKVIYAAPMTAVAEMVDPTTHITGEQVALILHNYPATVYLKEEN